MPMDEQVCTKSGKPIVNKAVVKAWTDIEQSLPTRYLLCDKYCRQSKLNYY